MCSRHDIRCMETILSDLLWMHIYSCIKNRLFKHSEDAQHHQLLFGVGLVEIEEGELTAQRLELQSQAVARTSFAKEPHVQQVIALISSWLQDCCRSLVPMTMLALLQPFRFAEFSSCGQMESSSRQFPWQQTTRHRCSTCTSSTIGHFDPKVWNT